MDQLDPAFLWWDEALELARLRALIHRRRQRVRGAAGFWIVSHAGDSAPELEVKERHPDADWDCEHCGAPLVRGLGTRDDNGTRYWAFSSAINGEIYCREPVGNVRPDWPSRVPHLPFRVRATVRQ